MPHVPTMSSSQVHISSDGRRAHRRLLGAMREQRLLEIHRTLGESIRGVITNVGAKAVEIHEVSPYQRFEAHNLISVRQITRISRPRASLDLAVRLLHSKAIAATRLLESNDLESLESAMMALNRRRKVIALYRERQEARFLVGFPGCSANKQIQIRLVDKTGHMSSTITPRWSDVTRIQTGGGYLESIEFASTRPQLAGAKRSLRIKSIQKAIDIGGHVVLQRSGGIAPISECRILALGKTLVAVRELSDECRFEAFMVLPASTVREIQVLSQQQSHLARLTDILKPGRMPLTNDALENMHEVLTHLWTKRATFPVLAFFRERLTQFPCFGVIQSRPQETLSIQQVQPSGRSGHRLKLHVSDLTRIDFGGGYLDSLGLIYRTTKGA